jgi:hypothetical protein
LDATVGGPALAPALDSPTTEESRLRASYSEMQTSYQAYGLHLLAGFSLQGMTPRSADRLPSLKLDLRTPSELAALWSGTPAEPTWRGRLGDGEPLTIEHGLDGDVLFSYGERARYRLDATMTRLDCAPSHSGPDWQRTLIGKVLPTVGVLRGYETLHAGVVDSCEGVVALAGPSGTGKSTLIVELLRRGWPLFADDALTLGEEDGTVLAHPGTPHMNLDLELPGGVDPHEIGSTLHMLAGERWMTAHASVSQTRPVRLVCLLERRPGLALESRALPSNPLLLAPYMLGLASDAERERRRFCLYADLMESAALVRLTAGAEHTPCQIADELERTLADTRQMVVEPA